MTEQPSLFAAEDPTPRPPGWRLIANSGGSQGWHLIDRTTPDRGVVTVCGIVGRVIQSDAVVIIPCVVCKAEPE